MSHDDQPLCIVWNYFQCLASVTSGEFKSLNIRHIVADEIHNFKERPNLYETLCNWWNRLLEICDGEESSCWFFYDLTQQITKEKTVKVPQGIPKRVLKTVIRTTGQIVDFSKRFIQDTSGITLGHDIQGPKPKILIPKSLHHGSSSERNLVNILLQVLHDLVVTKGHKPSSVSVLFSDDKVRKRYWAIFRKRAPHCLLRTGDEVHKKGIIFDTIRRYSGDENDIVVGFCPTFNYGRFQDNNALMSSLCSRPRAELILQFDSERTATSFGVQSDECEDIQPLDKQIWEFAPH